MICPKCQRDNDAVIDSRPIDGGQLVRRRRACDCGHRWITLEVDECRLGTFREFNRLVNDTVESTSSGARHKT